MIEFIHTEDPVSTMMARKDFATITKQPMVERPYWFRHKETGNEYYGIYAGIGWPQRLSERGDQLPGYGVVVGVLKNEETSAYTAPFVVLEELSEEAEDNLIISCVAMRERWGFGVHNDILKNFFGDYRQFELIVAHYNSVAIENGMPPDDAFIITPPDDFDSPISFDIYVGRLRYVVTPSSKRLFFHEHNIVRNRIRQFRRDDPSITAIGGLVHTLLMRTPWMDRTKPPVFQMAEP